MKLNCEGVTWPRVPRVSSNKNPPKGHLSIDNTKLSINASQRCKRVAC